MKVSINRRFPPEPCDSRLWGLTIAGVDGDSGGRSCHTAGEERPVEGRRPLRTGLAKIVEVGKQWEVNDRKWNIPGRNLHRTNKYCLQELCQEILIVVKRRKKKTKQKKNQNKQTRLCWFLPHECRPQSFVKALNAVRLEKLLGDLSSRHGSWCLDRRAGDVGAAGHGVGGHQLRRGNHDWLLLLGRCREKCVLEHCRPTRGLSWSYKIHLNSLTKSASILKLYLEHLHRRGDYNLTHASTAAG